MTAIVPHRGLLRVLRGTALAAVNASLAVAAHAAGGGPAPDGALTLLVTVAVAAAGIALADRRRGLPALLGAVTVTQALMHLLLDNLSGHHALEPLTPYGPAMYAAHGVAILLTAALLAGAESALFVFATVLGRLAALLPLVTLWHPPAPDRTVAAPVVTNLPVPQPRLLALVAPRRGPPVWC